MRPLDANGYSHYSHLNSINVARNSWTYYLVGLRAAYEGQVDGEGKGKEKEGQICCIPRPPPPPRKPPGPPRPRPPPLLIMVAAAAVVVAAAAICRFSCRLCCVWRIKGGGWVGVGERERGEYKGGGRSTALMDSREPLSMHAQGTNKSTN